jgi:hypothetical protein
MSDAPLPDDLANWPDDPFRLLGVKPGSSPRELKRAYHALIRKYKPEHAPELFRKIHEAYEAAQDLGSALSFERSNEDVDLRSPTPFPRDKSTQDRDYWEAAPDDEQRPGAPHDASPRPHSASVAWEIACAGDAASAYRALRDEVVSHSGREAPYVQLYWLLLFFQELDPVRAPHDWLIQGLRSCGPCARLLHELLAREAAADHDRAAGAMLDALLAPGTPPAVAFDAACWRWRAARRFGRWNAVSHDIRALRAWLPQANQELWARLLLIAAGNLVWAPDRNRDTADVLRHEAETCADQYAFDIADELTELEYAELISSGLQRVIRSGSGEHELYELLAISWDEPGPIDQRRLLSFLRDLVRDPQAGLKRLDLLMIHAPASLGLLKELSGLSPSQKLEPTLAGRIISFIGGCDWRNYPLFRNELLRFCLRQMIAPPSIAAAIAGDPNYDRRRDGHLADAIRADWPLHLIYRACERCWE